MKTIVIIGGSGFIGTKLAENLVNKGYLLKILDRNKSKLQNDKITYSICDVSLEINPEDIDGAFGIINLAGRNIGEKWNDKIKEEIYDSRINSTRNLVKAINSVNTKPTILISASAVGYYGDTKDQLIYEDAKAGNDFLARVCLDWETEALKAEALGLRVALVRTANVIGKGGLVALLKKIFEKHLGGYFGNGKQYMPWVSIDDIIQIYVYLLENPNAKGPYNTSAGDPITQKEFMQIFANVNNYWPVAKIPAFMAKIIMGEFAQSLLTGQKTSNSKLKELGYSYKYENLEDALKGNI